MQLLEYSSKNQINIIPKENFEELLQRTFDVVSSNIIKSLGPLGSSATILDGQMTEATKDGFTILKNYRFYNRYKRMVYNLIKVPCTRLNNTVGDGTTTAIVLTNYLFKEYKNKKSILDTLYYLPKTFTKIWDETVASVKAKIKGSKTTIDDIYNLAYVSSNGNSEISEAIASVYKECESPVIKQKDSPTNKSYIVPIKGYEFPVNLIDEAYVRNEDLSVEETNMAIMVFDHKIETDIVNNLIIPLNEIFRSMGKKLFVIAPFYDALLCNTVLKQYVNMEYQRYKALNLIIGQYEIGKLAKHQLNDFATILRTWVITQDMARNIVDAFHEGSEDAFVNDVMESPEHRYYRLFGTSTKAMLSCTNGATFEVNDIESDERYQDVLRGAKNELREIIENTEAERQSFAAKIYEAKARVNQLEMKNYIYYIGADSILQKKIIWDSVEDVIKCVSSAVKNGVIPGCQISIIKACTNIVNDIAAKYRDYDEKTETWVPKEGDAGIMDNDAKLRIIILEMIQNAALNTYARVLNGPEGEGMIKLIPNWFTYKDENIDELISLARKKCTDIINESIAKGCVFDLETKEFNKNIITSAETDIMILTAASELIKVLISGTQCIFLDSEINDSEVNTYSLE